MNKTTIISIYDNPSKFPPTLNAINELVKLNDTVVILYRDSQAKAELSQQTSFLAIPIKDTNHTQTPAWKKLLFFLRFTFSLWYYNIKYKPHLNLVYDCYTFTSFNLIKYLIPKTKIWYHNHDVTDLKFVSKNSLTYWCWKIEQKYLNKVNIFSLPDLSRSKYFNIKKEIDFLPNYPNLNFNPQQSPKNNSNSIIKIIYQGRVSDEHGILELINFINHTSHNITLDIIGSYDEVFKKKINSFIQINHLHEKIRLHDALPYQELKNFSKKFNIGWGVSQPVNIQYSTAAHASNKIYEYVACGMPVILFDDKHYKNALKKYNWAKFTDLSANSLNNIFKGFQETLRDDSGSAYADYRNHLHFEMKFLSIYQKLNI